MKNKQREGLKVAYRVIAMIVAVIMVLSIVLGSFFN